MVRRWIKRGLLSGLLVAVVLVPTQLVQGPTKVQAAEEAGQVVPFSAWSPAAGVVVTLGILTLIYAWRRRQAVR